MSYILVSLKHPEQKKTVGSVVSYFSDNKLALDFKLYDYKGNFKGAPEIIVFELGGDTSYFSREQLKLYKYAVRHNIQTKIMYLRKSDSSYQFYNFSLELLNLATNDQKVAYVHFDGNDTIQSLETMRVLSNLNRMGREQRIAAVPTPTPTTTESVKPLISNRRRLLLLLA